MLFCGPYTDADSPSVLLPLQPEKEFGIWRVQSIRVRDLHAPEQWTEEGKRLTEAVRELLLLRWTPVQVETYEWSFSRLVGTIQLPDGRSYREACLELMKDLGIKEGGR